jgi:hypothetical protein
VTSTFHDLARRASSSSRFAGTGHVANARRSVCRSVRARSCRTASAGTGARTKYTDASTAWRVLALGS